MPVNGNNEYYSQALSLPAAVVAPQLFSANASLPASPFDFEAAQSIFAQLNIHQFLTTAIAGANNDLTYIAVVPGASTVTITYAVAGTNTPLTVGVVGQAITVNVATNGGGAATSTAAQVLAAIQASAAASALVYVSLATGNDGSGVVAALGSTALGGPTGTAPTLDVSLKHGINTFMATHSAFAQKTSATQEMKSFASVASKGQWVFTVGGTTPVFAASIDVIYRRS